MDSNEMKSEEARNNQDAARVWYACRQDKHGQLIDTRDAAEQIARIRADERRKLQASSQVVTDNTETLRAALARIEELEKQIKKERTRSKLLLEALNGLLDPEADTDESYRVAYQAKNKYQEEDK
jgi:hypothetical protein